ncbi:mucin-4-like [Pantherophis guttatus]|uniref:Mucin-4-like n=1 Tax=Pantherophis guttatus TaxID=94885 RepID=A0A6P9BXU1_PANGU|nr:mucin-4-like [Pantherophis guttatus]
MKRIFQTIRKKADADQFLGTYLDEFNSFVMKNRDLLSNINIRDELLMLSAEINFPQMSALSLKDMAGWLERLNILLPGINGTMLELLPLDMSCPYFQAVVKALDGVYSTLSSRKRQDIYGFQKTYLTAQLAVSGSACDGGTIGIQDLLLKNFGKFCSMAKLSELQAFYPELNGVEKPPVYISPKETADFTNIAQMLQNATLARRAIGMIKNFSNYYSLHEYLSRLQRDPCQDTIDTAGPCRQSSPSFIVEIQQEILENALFFLKKEGSSMNSSQWREAYFLLFSNILPHPRTVHLSKLAPKLSCHLHTILKAITALHPSLIKQEEELVKVRPLCYSGRHHPNIKATIHILATVTKYSYQDETHNKHRIVTTFPHQTNKSHVLGDTTKQNLESSPGNKLRSREVDITGHATIHNLRNNTSGFFENVANKPIPIPEGATKGILQSITTHISGIPRFTSSQSARMNTLRDATNDVTRNTTDDLTGNITIHGLGRTSRHISGSSRTDIPRTTILDIHRTTSRWIPKSVTQISRNDSNDILGNGNIPESAMLDISESTARWSAVQMLEKTTSRFHGNITHHYPKSFPSEIPNDITKLENTITHIPGNDNSKILASVPDNISSTCTIPHNYGGSTSIQESISANFYGTHTTHIPGYTTENILMDSRTHSLGIGVENNSSDAKGNIYEVAITHNPADVTVNQHTVHILESKNENASRSVMKYILKSSIPPSINGAMGMPGIISDYISRSTPAGGVTDIPSTFTENILGNTVGKILESITAHFPSVRSSNIPGDAMSKFFEGTTIHIPGDAAASISTNKQSLQTHNPRGTTGNILKNEGTTGGVTDNLLTGIRSHILGNALGNTCNASASTPRNNPRRLTIHKLEDVNSKFLKGIVTNIPEDALIKMSSEVTANIDGTVTSNLPRDVTFILGTHSNWTDVVTRYISTVFLNTTQSAVGNIPNDDLAHITKGAIDNMLENITIHTILGNIDTMGNSPRDAADNIPRSTTTNILGSVINNVPEDTSVHNRDRVTSNFSSSITVQMVRGATVNILKSITASVLRSTTEGGYIPSLKNSIYNILHGATGNLSGETTGNVNGDTIPKTYDATGNKPKISITHSPGNGAMNYISGGVTTPFSKSTTGNMFQSITPNAKKIAMGYDHKAVDIHEGTMGNISGGAIIHIPEGTTASVPGTNKNLGSAISNNEASVIYKPTATDATATISIASGGRNISSDLTLNISKGTIPEGSRVPIASSATDNNIENKTTLFLDGFSSNITIGIPDHIRGHDHIGTLVTISGVVPSVTSDNDRYKDATASADVITPILVSVNIQNNFTSNSAGYVTSNIPINDTTSIFKDATVSIPMGSTKHNREDKATHVHDESEGNSHNDATGNISQITSPISGSTRSTLSTIFGGGPTHLPGKGNEDGAPGGPNHDSSGDVTTSIFVDATTHNPSSLPDKGNTWANPTVPVSFYCVLTLISVMVSL